ncbi:SpoIIE family protein phosphatase [Streptomyces sp. NRRL WC-3744]|uniref:SpoIIE family protein phosphatase n=1 Tax=Streptomyces sp. NRRL WC-3744 TaxID=1463935 RepID=UPI0004C89B11|nr:SpoIIE family protein phosphatase [Streptomyces sp. NRRL WC-3744]
MSSRHDSGDLSATVLEALFTQAPMGLYVFDEQLRIVRYNTAGRGVRGLPSDAVLGRRLDEVAEGFHDPELLSLARQVLTGEARVRNRLMRGRPPGDPDQETVLSVSAFRVRPGGGHVLGVAVVEDVSARQHTVDRLDILHDAHHAIGTSLDVRDTAVALAEVVVDRFADAVSVDVLDEVVRGAALSGGPVDADVPLRRVAFRSVNDPERQTPSGTLDTFPFPTPFSRSLQDASPRLVTHLTPDEPWLATDPERARLLTDAGVHSLLVIPLVVHGTVLGVACFYRHRDPRPYDENDLSLAEQLAQRTALSIDNARSYARERTIATALQRHLLPRTPPRLTTVDTAALHLPGSVGGGGDWYDVIPLSGGRVALTVGDVTGSGIEVAAAMGRLRTALTTLAVRDLAPDELLSCLDETTVSLALDRGEPVTASCLYAVFDPVTRTCTAASAGHAPPVALGALGDPLVLEPPAGPLLGAGRGGYEAVRVELPDGSLLALYTNGLVRAAANARQTLLRLLSHPDRPLRQLADDAVYALLPGQSEDDAVLLLARTRGLAEDRLAEWTLPKDPAVVGTARRLAEHQLSAWGLEDLSFTTELIVSELVTNAIRYGSPPIRLRMIRDRSLMCEVSDGSSTAPHLRNARSIDEGGRGLALVAQLAARWGTRFGRRGKTIWSEQELDGG